MNRVTMGVGFFAAAVSAVAINGCSMGNYGGCPEDEEVFRTEVWEPVLTESCVICHNPTGAASGTQMVFKDESSGEDWLLYNLQQVAAIAAQDADGSSLLLAKPTNTHSNGHGGGEIMREGSASYEALAFYVDWVRGDVESCDVTAFDSCDDSLAGPRLLRRLTHTAYDNTIRDLLGLESTYGTQFAGDEVVGGFANNAEVLTVPGLLGDQYRAAAEALSEDAVTYRLAELAPCDLETSNYTACGYAFIHTFGKRAFRRPMSEDDTSRYRDLFALVAADEGYSGGVRWVIAAMLQSPHFLYRSELGEGVSGGLFALSDYEIATELSYMLWDTMPDEELFAMADAGVLSDLESPQAQEQIERMLADPKFAGTVPQFIEQWLHLDRLMIVPKTMDAYPDLSLDVRVLMEGETERLIAEQVASESSLADLFLSEHSYMTDELAAYYGLQPSENEADSHGYRRIDLSGEGYGGFLTQGSLMVTYGLPSTSSPIHRGVLVRERLLCQELPPPPPNLEITPPEVDETLSTRDRYAQHSEDPACSECHVRIDPIGFGFEHFDGAGVYRDVDGAHDVDASGEIIESDSSDGQFYGVEELSELLVSSSDLESCFVDMWVSYAVGLHEQPELACGAEEIAASFEGSPGLTEPLRKIASLQHFRMRSAGSDEGDGFASGPGVTLEDVEDIEELESLLDGSGGGSTGEPPGDLDFALNEVSRWGTGYCADGHVTNNGTGAVTWEVSAAIEGSINNIWNANKFEEGGSTVFTGMDWNATIQPGGTASFGFCADI